MSRSYQIALLPGDGTGIEVAAQARKTLDAVSKLTGITFVFDPSRRKEVFDR